MLVSIRHMMAILIKYLIQIKVWVVLLFSLIINGYANTSNAQLTMSSNRIGQILFTRNMDTNSLLGLARRTGIPEHCFYQYDVTINMAASHYHIDPLLIKAILLIESSLDANAISKASAACGIAVYVYYSL